MTKIIFTNAHIVDPTQKINRIGSLTVENKKITDISRKRVHEAHLRQRPKA